ncbi:MAG TPA: tetratricopeptide repeat protein [Stellaceae bacterium]|nr:tetratricopeptide repeat protein [Stellaceae bacterium]
MSAPAALFWFFAALALAGCAASPVHLDALSVDGRDGGGPTPTYPMLMRIGAAARAGGDLPNAIGVFRRAAEMAPQDPAPLIAAGEVLLQMGAVNEAIVSFNAALVRPGDTQWAQVGLAKAYLKSGKPQLALAPLSKALEVRPDDPKLLLLLGVTRDLAEQHAEAQSYYRRGLSLAPGDPALTVDLALSLALSGDYSSAIAVLQPVARTPTASPQERQTLALIYGLNGNTAEAARINAVDLDESSVERNLAYYQTLRELSPDARARAILSAGRSGSAAQSS